MRSRRLQIRIRCSRPRSWRSNPALECFHGQGQTLRTATSNVRGAVSQGSTNGSTCYAIFGICSASKERTLKVTTSHTVPGCLDTSAVAPQSATKSAGKSPYVLRTVWFTVLGARNFWSTRIPLRDALQRVDFEAGPPLCCYLVSPHPRHYHLPTRRETQPQPFVH